MIEKQYRCDLCNGDAKAGRRLRWTVVVECIQLLHYYDDNASEKMLCINCLTALKEALEEWGG